MEGRFSPLTGAVLWKMVRVQNEWWKYLENLVSGIAAPNVSEVHTESTELCSMSHVYSCVVFPIEI